MAELRSALEESLAGRGQMVMLVGEPGIGKTRCAQELATIAQVRGAQVVWGQCHESEGAPPYWIWTQAIRSYIQDKDEAQLLSVMGVGASDIAEVVPEVKLRMPDLESSPQLESPEQARFRLFDSVTTFLKNASRSQPLIIILDDLQWADRSSLMLLEFMVREMRTSRLLVVGTYRDVDISRDHQLSQVLGVLTREQLFTRVNFSGLSQEEVGDYVKTASSISPIPGLAEAVFGRTNGNPLFVSEVVRLLEQEGIEDNQSWATAIPEGVRDAIGRRLNRLSKECNRVLTTASVIGREFSLDLLDMLIDWADEDQLLDLLEQALSTHVIEEIPRTLGRYQFSHALIQDTLSDEMSATRRIRLHARIAEGLEGLYGSDAPAHAGEIAYHFAQAEQVLGGEKLLLYSTIAGERDLDSYAYESALAHFQRALGAREDQPMDDQLAAIMLGIGLSVGRSMASVDEAQQAWDALSQAFDYYVEQGDIEKALHVAFQPIPVMMYVSGAADLSARALELVPSESLQAGYLLSRRAGSLAYDSNDSDGSRSAAIKAIAIARRENDEILEARSLAFLVTPLLIDHRAQEAIEAGLRAAEIAKRTGDFESEMLANFYSSQILFVIGEPDRSRSHADAAYKVAVKLHDRENQFFCLVNMAVCAAYEGKWANANQLADQGLEIISHNVQMIGLKAWISLQRADVEAAKQLEVYLSSPPTEPNFVLFWLGIALRIAYETNDFQYLDIVETALSAGERSTNSLRRFWSRQSEAIVAVLRNDEAAAAEQYSALEQDKGTVGNSCFNVDHILGLLAKTLNNLDDARTQFEDAMTFCRKANYRPELAWTLYDYSDMLIEGNGISDQYMAKALLDESLSISTELDMGPLKERVESRRDAV
ncbi:MAG: AAA family ATPase [Chloroflexi bacterium]|nr:AAA family ATPase [Chloroflexota bacterium]